MSLFAFAGRLLWPNRPPPRPQCRLSETEALQIARAALGEDQALMVEDVVQTSQGVQWRIGTGEIGSSRAVLIQDDTGEVCQRLEWSGR